MKVVYVKVVYVKELLVENWVWKIWRVKELVEESCVKDLVCEINVCGRVARGRGLCARVSVKGLWVTELCVKELYVRRVLREGDLDATQ